MTVITPTPMPGGASPKPTPGGASSAPTPTPGPHAPASASPTLLPWEADQDVVRATHRVRSNHALLGMIVGAALIGIPCAVSLAGEGRALAHRDLRAGLGGFAFGGVIGGSFGALGGLLVGSEHDVGNAKYDPDAARSAAVQALVGRSLNTISPEFDAATRTASANATRPEDVVPTVDTVMVDRVVSYGGSRAPHAEGLYDEAVAKAMLDAPERVRMLVRMDLPDKLGTEWAVVEGHVDPRAADHAYTRKVSDWGVPTVDAELAVVTTKASREETTAGRRYQVTDSVPTVEVVGGRATSRAVDVLEKGPAVPSPRVYIGSE